MSHLVISGASQSFSMNVVSFNSTVYESVASVQTRKVAVHFPIKMTQPDVSFNVVFSNENRFEDFQKFVCNHQQMVLESPRSLLTLNWPERNINNWTGVIAKFQAGGQRRNYMPRASFDVDLVNSMASGRSDFASVAMPWQSIYGAIGMTDAILTLPSAAGELIMQQNWGNNGRGFLWGEMPTI